MPFDLSKVAPEKRAELEKALTEVGSSITELETVHTELEAQKKATADAEAAMKQMESNWAVANDEYSKVVDSLSATEKEKESAQSKLDKAEREKIEAQAKLAESLKNQPRFDPDKFVSREQMAEEIKKTAAYQTAYFGETLETVEEIHRLTGTKVSAKKLLTEAIANKKTPAQYAEETYKLQEKRDSEIKTAQDKRDKENENKGYQRAIEESRNPALRTLESSEEPFYTPKVGDKPKQPWDMVDGEVAKDEQDFLKELTTGRVQ